MKTAIIFALLLLSTITLAQEVEIPTSYVYAEIGRLTLLVKVLNERIGKLEQENKMLQSKLDHYEHVESPK